MQIAIDFAVEKLKSLVTWCCPRPFWGATKYMKYIFLQDPVLSTDFLNKRLVVHKVKLKKKLIYIYK